MLGNFRRFSLILLGLLALETIAGGGVLFAQPDDDQNADELIRSAQQYELMGYILAGIAVLMVAAVLPIAFVLYRRARTEGQQANAIGKRERPYWVALALWGLPTRAWAWTCFWLAVAIAGGCIALGFIEPVFFIGGLILMAALWYYAAILWVDQNGSWP